MPPEKHRIIQLDGVRGIAIVLVFVHHAEHVRLLWMGVDIFFVLSGFLITGVLFNGKELSFRAYIGSFYARRAQRILPPYVIVLALTSVLLGAGWLRYWYFYFGAMNVQAAFWPRSAIALPLWSLAVEEQFYLLWPLAVYLLSRKQLIHCAIGLLALAPLLRYLCTPFFADGLPIYMLLPFRMDTMAAGALLALLWPELRTRLASARKLRGIIAVAASVVACLSLICLYLLNKHGMSPSSNTALGNFAVYECTLGISASLFLAALIGVAKQLLSLWPLVWLGRVSYTLYLVHIPAMVLSPKNHFFLPLFGCLTFSVSMWFLIEKPILGLGRKRPPVLIQHAEILVAN